VEPTPLAPEDRGILALECDTVAGHTCKVAVLGDPAPAVEALARSIGERVSAVPALTRRLGGTESEPAWVDDEDFRVADHVVEGPTVARAELREAVAQLFEQRLDRSRPLWRLDVVGLREGGAALVWRIHHALADGTTSVRWARELLWDREQDTVRPAPGPSAHDDERRRAHLAAFVHREFARARQASPFDGAIGTRRQVAMAAAPLGALHEAARSLGGATLNDAVLTSIAGGLRRWIEHHHGALGTIRVRVPVSLHHEGDDAGNRDSFFSVGLPLNEADPVARLDAVRRQTAARKAGRDAEEMDDLLRRLGGVSPQLERFCARLEDSPRRFAVSVSNVPGPRSPVSVLGAPVVSLHSIAEIGERHALRVSAMSMADTMCFGFCADPAIVDGLDVMAEGVEQEAAALVSAAR
jgi:diacylglycerol O-acyltransferase / wax synthase